MIGIIFIFGMMMVVILHIGGRKQTDQTADYTNDQNHHNGKLINVKIPLHAMAPTAGQFINKDCCCLNHRENQRRNALVFQAVINQNSTDSCLHSNHNIIEASPMGQQEMLTSIKIHTC